MSFLIAYKKLTVHYSIPENNHIFENFKAYLTRLVGFSAEFLSLSFLDLEDDVYEIKDQFDFEYFLKCSEAKQTTLNISLVERPENNPQLMIRSNDLLSEEKTSQITESLCSEKHQQIPFNFGPQKKELAPKMAEIFPEESFSLTEFDHRQDLEILPKAEKDNLNASNFDSVLRQHPDFINCANLLTDFQTSLFNQIQELKGEITKIKASNDEIISKGKAEANSDACRFCQKSIDKGKKMVCLECKNFSVCEKCFGIFGEHEHQIVLLNEGDKEIVALANLYKILEKMNKEPNCCDKEKQNEILSAIYPEKLVCQEESLGIHYCEKRKNQEYLKDLGNYFK